MKAPVTVCISTFGDYKWFELAKTRALKSVQSQTIEPEIIMYHHDTSLAFARNEAAKKANTEFLIFLDADDELDSHYVEAMLTGTTDVRQPATLGIVNGIEDDFPVVIPQRDLMTSNYIVIGAMCKRELFEFVGGFDDYPVLEDWALWIKMHLVGATIAPVSEAIYRVHVNPDSRNQNHALHGQVYSMIRARFGSKP